MTRIPRMIRTTRTRPLARSTSEERKASAGARALICTKGDAVLDGISPVSMARACARCCLVPCPCSVPSQSRLGRWGSCGSSACHEHLPSPTNMDHAGIRLHLVTS